MPSSRVNLLRRGVGHPPPPREALRAGPLSLALEGGDLRSIRLGEIEVVRRLHLAVRDRNWGTVPTQISDRVVESAGRTFAVSFLAEHREGPIDFSWRGTIRGDLDGTITFRMEGEARSTFERNRIGICLLHPIRECSGRPCVVEHVDGTIQQGAFPDRIAPHQPFRDIRSISHEVRPGLHAAIRFEGETFEMEDQRNWIDGSFKTYGTPLGLPFPVAIARGTRIAQSVAIRLEGDVPREEPDPPDGPVTLRIGPGACGHLYRFGLGVASHGRPLSPREVDRLRALNLLYLRVDLHPSRPDFSATYREAAAQARAIGCDLLVALFLSDVPKDELDEVARAIEEIDPPGGGWIILPVSGTVTDEARFRLARGRLGELRPGSAFLAGTNAYFTELNRDYRPIDHVVAVCYSINPQVHAFDDASIVETLEALGEAVCCARERSKRRVVCVSPVTLRPRFNPNATGANPEPAPGELPAQVDPRQRSLFGACWTLGSIKALAEQGALLTLFETTGWLGVMEAEAGSPNPDRFPSRPGEVFPLYHVLADVGQRAGSPAIETVSGAPLEVVGLTLGGPDQRVLVANLSPDARTIRVEGLGAEARIRMLDETTADEAMQDPEAFRSRPVPGRPTDAGVLNLDLLPYALARIDSGWPGGTV